MKILAWILFALAIFLNLWTLKDGHNWGDDFAQYIICARNIIEGRPYGAGIMLDNPIVYPPGLPLMLAPVLKVFGLNFKILKSLNVLCWYLSIIFLYALFLRIEGRRFALMATVLLAFSSSFFIFKQNVLSDVPFFLFVCSSLYTFQRWEDIGPGRQGRLFFMGFLFSMSAALWVRSAGFVLFGAALFYVLFIKRNIKALAAILTTFLMNEVWLFFWSGWHPGVFSPMWQRPGECLICVFINFATVFRSLWYFFCPPQTVLSHALLNMVDPVIGLAAPVFYLIIVWSFIRGLRNKNLSYLECFSFFYMSLFILWSAFHDTPRGFYRYVFPLLPFILTAGWRLLVFRWARVIFSVLLVLNLSNIIHNWYFDDDMLNLPASRELVTWVKHNMKPDEHFMFARTRALTLLTGRVGITPWSISREEPDLPDRVKAFKISYVVAFKIDERFITRLAESKQFRLIWENEGYKVFALNG